MKYVIVTCVAVLLVFAASPQKEVVDAYSGKSATITKWFEIR